MSKEDSSSSHRSDRTPLVLRNVDARRAAGRALRDKVSRSSQAALSVRGKGRDIVAMLETSNRGRVPSLVPIRYGRMLHSPFSFFRGAAAIMAYDLARALISGIAVQACGDAHLMNFGGFATPERNLIFDVNDFDETLRASWEWDLKRLAASVTLAGRHLGFSKHRNRYATMTAVAGYREQMALFARMRALELWYQRIDATRVAELHFNSLTKKASAAPPHPVTEHFFPKLTEAMGDARRIREEVPLLFRPRKGDHTIGSVRRLMAKYTATLSADRRGRLLGGVV